MVDSVVRGVRAYTFSRFLEEATQSTATISIDGVMFGGKDLKNPESISQDCCKLGVEFKEDGSLQILLTRLETSSDFGIPVINAVVSGKKYALSAVLDLESSNPNQQVRLYSKNMFPVYLQSIGMGNEVHSLGFLCDAGRMLVLLHRFYTKLNLKMKVMVWFSLGLQRKL